VSRWNEPGTTQALAWCAGCHDPVAFFFQVSFDDRFTTNVRRPDGATRVDLRRCHGSNRIDSNIGTPIYTIAETTSINPITYSDPSVVQSLKLVDGQWRNRHFAQKEMHYSSNPYERDNTEFCSVVTKVSLP